MGKWTISLAVAVAIGTVVLTVLIVYLAHPTVEKVPSDGYDLGPSRCPDHYPYRTLDGSCNNLDHPDWGSTLHKYARLLPARYSDGIHMPPLSLSGQPLPNTRTLSLTLYGDVTLPDPELTIANMQWGQIVAHDLSRLLRKTGTVFVKSCCCSALGRVVPPDDAYCSCYPILIPPNDPDYNQAGTECLRFARTVTDRDIGSNYSGGPAEQITDTTSFLDLSLMYGNSEEQNRELRALRGGRMLVEERHGRQLLPDAPYPKLACVYPSSTEACYLSGDERVNQNPGLAIFQTMLLTEHNRLADALATLNPHWGDSALFEEARKINIAQFQHISYYEWLPNLLGTQNMINHRLIYAVPPGTFVNDYDPNVDPSVLNENACAALRSFHNQIVGRCEMFSEARDITGSIRLSDWVKRPEIIEVADNFDTLARGLATQPSALTDLNFDKEISLYLFKNNETLGTDLHAHDIHRGRDHGLSSYNDMREFCGLRRAHEWSDFEDLIDPQIVQKLQSLYEFVDDVDLIVGGSLESHVEDALAGPTLLCILNEQFRRTRIGDRYFFENSNPITGLSGSQLQEVRKSSVARILCDNANIQSIQPRAFHTISELNHLVPCADIPQLDLSHWTDAKDAVGYSTSEATLSSSVK